MWKYSIILEWFDRRIEEMYIWRSGKRLRNGEQELWVYK